MAEFSLTEKQSQVAQTLIGKETHHLIYGGARSGKTALICYAIQARAVKAPKSRHLIARHHFNHVKASVGRDTFPKILDLAYPDVECRFDKVTSIFEFGNGAEVWLAGLDDKDRVDKVLGTEFATIFVNEASQVSYHAVTTLRTRLAQNVNDVSGRMLPLRGYYDLNPTSRGHWTYKEFIEGVDPSSGKPMRLDDEGRPLPPHDRTVNIMNPTDNPHLPAIYMDELRSMPLSKRMRFLEGRYLEEAPNSLWKIAQFDACRMIRPPDNLQRIAVGIDPSGARGADDDKADDIGIVVVGRDPDGVAYLLGDYTMKGSPEQWAREAVRAFRKHQADVMVCERNYGGDMVRTVIQAVDKSIEPKMVTASRGKHVRAEPVAALYESCVTADTLISCERGNVPICEVTTDDLVWTRAGLKSVLWAGQTGDHETIEIEADGRKLRLTKNHPVLTGDGWVHAGHLSHKEREVFVWEKDAKFAAVGLAAIRGRRFVDLAQRRNAGKRSQEKFSDLMSNLAGFVTTKTLLDTGSHVGMARPIAQFGDMSTQEKFPQSGMSIMSMEIPATTIRKILSRLSGAITFDSIIHQVQSLSQNPKTALNAERNSQLDGLCKFFAGPHVSARDTRQMSGVVEPVYNLYIQDKHEYVANGLLVHNCRVFHCGEGSQYANLESELVRFTANGFSGTESPNRADAMVWAFHELFFEAGEVAPFQTAMPIMGFGYSR